MSAPKGNVVIAGDAIYAGIDMDDVEATGEIPLAMVVQFKSHADLRAAIQQGACSFTMFEAQEMPHG